MFVRIKAKVLPQLVFLDSTVEFVKFGGFHSFKYFVEFNRRESLEEVVQFD